MIVFALGYIPLIIALTNIMGFCRKQEEERKEEYPSCSCGCSRSFLIALFAYFLIQ
jgi:hypothetical protein